MALPEINKNSSNKNELAVKKNEVTSSKADVGSNEQSFFTKMFNNIEKTSKSEKTVSDNKKAIADYLSRQNNDIDEMRIIRKISDNTDTIIDLLKDLKLQGIDKKGFDWKSLLPSLLPLIAGLAAAVNPEKAKPYQTIVKAAPVLAKGAGKAAQLAANAVESSKAAKLAKEAELGTDAAKAAGKSAEVIKDTSKVAGALGSAAKALGKVGNAVSESPFVNKAIRYTGIGMTAGRALEGDYVGATAEAGSLALHEASRKAKSPKTKALLTAASLGTDAGIMVRDYFNGQEEKDKASFAKEHGFVAPEKESVSTKLFGMFGVETDQASRIKEQKAALTDENKAALASYDESKNSGFEKVKNVAEDVLPFAAMAATPLIGKLFRKDGLTSKIAETAIGGTKDPIVESGQKFADIVIDAANSFKDSGSYSNGRRNSSGRGRGNRNSKNTSGRNRLNSPAIEGEFRDITPSNRPAIPLESGPSNAKVAKSGATLGKLSNLKSLLPASISGIGSVGAKGVAKGAAKLGAKAIPGLGLALGAYGTVSRISEGDYIGALGEAASGIASTVPIIGTAASVAIQGGLMYRDSVKEINEDTSELNTITKGSIDELNKASSINGEQLNNTTSLINDSNKTIVKNSNDTSSLLSKTGTELTSFTSQLGNGIADWLLKGGSIFSLAFATMNGIKNVIGNVLSKIGLDKINPFKDNSSDNGQINYKLDTGKGEYDLGKHGGTMTSSIMKGESGGNYGIYNGSNGGKGGTLNNANTSVDQIISAQNNKQMNAFGAYQIIGDTMKDAKLKLGLKGDEKMTAALQDKIYQDYLIKKKRKAIFNYITGKDNNLNTAVLAGAMEWASIGVPHDMDVKDKKGNVIRRLKKGQSYYAGIQGNAANITPEEFGLGLQQQKARYFNLKKKGLSDDDAYHQSFKKGEGGVSAKEAAGELVGAVGSGIDSVKSFFSKDKKDSGNVVTKDGNVIPATLAKPSSSSTTSIASPAKQNASTIVKNAEKAVGINKTNDKAKSNANALASTKTEDKSSSSNKTKADWDLDVLCKTAVANAQKGSTKDCALYVRKALEKAQTKKIFNGGLGHAKDYVKSLPRIGWEQVGKNSSDIKKGDIAVFPKSSNSHDYGHVCIFTGKYWVSDFVQRQVQPNSSGTWDYYLFRAKSGYTNGTPESASPTDLEKAAGSAGAAASGLGGSETSADSTGTEENKSIIDKAIDAAVAGIAPLAAAFGNSETARNALNWVNSAKVDNYQQRNVDKADLTGFNFNSSMQSPGNFKYKFGNGGGYNENELFNPNLERQKGSTNDLIGDAGRIPGIVRQQQSAKDYLADGGYIAGIVRQQDHGTEIGNSTFKKKKLKWYEKLFGSSRTNLFGDLAESLGFGDIFNLGKEIYSADKSGNLKDYGINKALDMMSKDDKLSDIGNLGKEIYSADKKGNLKDYAIDKTLKYLLSPNDEQSKQASPNNVITKKEAVDDALKGINVTKDGKIFIKQVDTGNGTKLNKYVDQTTGEVSFGPEDNSDNDAIAKLIKEKGPLSINPVSSALNNISNNTTDNDPIGTLIKETGGQGFNSLAGDPLSQIPELRSTPKAIMNLLLDGKDDEKNGLNMLFNGIHGAAERIKINPRSSKDGWGGLVNKSIIGASNFLFGDESKSGLKPAESIAVSNPTTNLSPNVTEKEKINGYISSINREYMEMKDNKKNTKSDNLTQTSAPPSGTTGKKGNLDGMSSSIVTRNPDSIFRAVSIDIMKTSTT